MEDKIVVKNVSKMFGKEKVLDNVSQIGRASCRERVFAGV